MEEQEIQLKVFRDNLKFITEKMYDESIILDNKFLFQFEDKWYRVRMPNQRELADAEDYRNRIQVEFLQQKGCITEENLKKVLKENNVIDIYSLEEEKIKLLQDIKDLYPSLAVKYSDETEAIKTLENKIDEITLRIQEISQSMAQYLASSLESRIQKAFLEYITALCTEYMVEKDQWVVMWPSFKEFDKDNSLLTQKAVASMYLLFLNRKDF